ncbi:hypothetical protein B0H14DRAFT_3440126 [Mycena olivaceomarginata]|nr:hypothetical protein B0H14DRAFT_3440126 [Mycena olivaceomarginata]
MPSLSYVLELFYRGKSYDCDRELGYGVMEEYRDRSYGDTVCSMHMTLSVVTDLPYDLILGRDWLFFCRQTLPQASFQLSSGVVHIGQQPTTAGNRAIYGSGCDQHGRVSPRPSHYGPGGTYEDGAGTVRLRLAVMAVKRHKIRPCRSHVAAWSTRLAPVSCSYRRGKSDKLHGTAL